VLAVEVMQVDGHGAMLSRPVHRLPDPSNRSSGPSSLPTPVNLSSHSTSSWGVRYAQGGGLTDTERASRERIREQAVVRFEGGEKNREVAAVLRASERSVERWRRAWRAAWRAAWPTSSRRVLRGVRGSAKCSSPGWSGSWSVGRWSTAERISD
jgi:hypothetical protein